MHELGITQSIIDHARETAQANGARRVTDIFLAMTPAADFSQESIEMYFDMLTGEDDYFMGARLHFDHQPGAARCMGCGEVFTAHAQRETCPRCSSWTVAFDADAPAVQITDIGIDDGRE